MQRSFQSCIIISCVYIFVRSAEYLPEFWENSPPKKQMVPPKARSKLLLSSHAKKRGTVLNLSGKVKILDVMKGSMSLVEVGQC
jgi:hypothetical protein